MYVYCKTPPAEQKYYATTLMTVAESRNLIFCPIRRPAPRRPDHRHVISILYYVEYLNSIVNTTRKTIYEKKIAERYLNVQYYF